ncbi:hypothetical protein BDZ45DRAFT_692975 [Acephala macrosclerotiorum]|nr:hypothetical protein BDZ45DRAFT_692975 [Acephala macrosclerotiorum]
MGCCSSRPASFIKHPYSSAEHRKQQGQANNGQVDGPGEGLRGTQLDKVNKGFDAHVRESRQGTESPGSEEGQSPARFQAIVLTFTASLLNLGPGMLPMGRTVPERESLEPRRTMTMSPEPADPTSQEAPVSKYCPIPRHGEYQVRGYPIGEGTLEICPACRAVG